MLSVSLSEKDIDIIRQGVQGFDGLGPLEVRRIGLELNCMAFDNPLKLADILQVQLFDESIGFPDSNLVIEVTVDGYKCYTDNIVYLRVPFAKGADCHDDWVVGTINIPISI